jgi:hypothetical protein
VRAMKTGHQYFVPLGLPHSACSYFPPSDSSNLGLQYQPLSRNASAFVSGISACVMPMGSFWPQSLGFRNFSSLACRFAAFFCFLGVVLSGASAFRFSCCCGFVGMGTVCGLRLGEERSGCMWYQVNVSAAAAAACV